MTVTGDFAEYKAARAAGLSLDDVPDLEVTGVVIPTMTCGTPTAMLFEIGQTVVRSGTFGESSTEAPIATAIIDTGRAPSAPPGHCRVSQRHGLGERIDGSAPPRVQ